MIGVIEPDADQLANVAYAWAEPRRAADLWQRCQIDFPQACEAVGTEVARVGAIPKDPVWQRANPEVWAAKLRSSIDKTDEILWLHRRPLGEHDDYEHRTDPDDDSPEAGFIWRVLRRIFP